MKDHLQASFIIGLKGFGETSPNGDAKLVGKNLLHISSLNNDS